MKFTLTVPASWNFCPRDLMNKFAGNDFGNGTAGRYIVTYDRYFTTVLYDQKTAKAYEYDHLKMEHTAHSDTIKVTVFLKEQANEDY